MSTVLCLLCHADDEFAIFAEIEAMIAEGRRVVCVYLTDGAYGGQSAERRAGESRVVLRRLGVADEDVLFFGNELGIGDTKLHERIADGLEAARRLVDRDAPHLRILVPAWEGGHHDHDAAHLIGLVLSRECCGAELFQFSIYHGHGVPWKFFRVMAPIRENGPVVARHVPWRDRLRYLGLYFTYASQWKTWLALGPGVLANYAFVGRQRLQLADPARVRQRPHPGALLYERRGFCTWTEFVNATADIRAAIDAGAG